MQSLYLNLTPPQVLHNHTFLVTGGAGFIGSNIVEYLVHHQAKRIVILDNLSTGFRKNIEPFLQNPSVQFIQGDVTDFDTCLKACAGIDFVLHQAALGSVPRSIENPIATHQANATGQLTVLWAAKQAGVKRVVYASSSSVYGDSKILPKEEAHIGNPLSPYAVSKLVNEQYGKIFHHSYGLEVVGLRYFNIFGPRQSPSGAYAAAIPLFINALLTKSDLYINGDGEQTRDFTFVANAVQANMGALFASSAIANGSVFNIACGQQISLNKLVNTLKQKLQSTQMPIYRDARPGDVRDSLANISRAQQHLNYNPTVSLESGIDQTIHWFKQTVFDSIAT